MEGLALGLSLFVGGGAEHAVGGVPAADVVEAFDEVAAGGLGLGAGGEVTAVEQFAFQGGEEALGDRVIETVPDRPRRGADAGLLAALPEAE